MFGAARIVTATDACNVFGVGVAKNGVLITPDSQEAGVRSDLFLNPTGALPGLAVYLDADDYVELWVYQASDGTTARAVESRLLVTPAP